MKVVKRNGQRETVSFDKVSIRLARLAQGYITAGADAPVVLRALTKVDHLLVAQKVIEGIYDGVTTSELDTLAAETASHMSTTHPEYDEFASRIAASNLQKETESSYVVLVRRLHGYVNTKNGRNCPLVSDSLLQTVVEHAIAVQSKLDYSLDFSYSYFGFKTLQQGYLLKMDGRIVERPQHMLMRVALGIHGADLDSAFRTYNLMSHKVFTHASPTMFNAGTARPQLSSCFLLQMVSDSIEGIYETLTRCAKISKAAGGVGVNVSNIRAKGSYIAGTHGNSNGLSPMLRVFNATARYVDQGGGKRKGAFAIYIEPWHADIFDVLELKKNTGPDELRARDLFYGLWIPDLFMKRVMEGEMWSLMCPVECPGLCDVWGADFEALYTVYETSGMYVRQVPAETLFRAILESQIESGTPYMLYKDAANRKSNQQNLGTMKGSNLCTEIIEFTSPDEVAVCNLASVSLPAFVSGDRTMFLHDQLYAVVYEMTINLNRVIDVNDYPLVEAKRSNLRHRPIGLGVQGLADVFFLMRLPFESQQARGLNRDIFETIYYAACNASVDLAAKDGPYDSYRGSPLSKGQLQFDLWNVTPKRDWSSLRAKLSKYGMRNSLLVAPMPTASTAQILGNTECFEALSSNIFSRSTLAGSFKIVNAHLVRRLLLLAPTRVPFDPPCFF